MAGELGWKEVGGRIVDHESGLRVKSGFNWTVFVNRKFVAVASLRSASFASPPGLAVRRNVGDGTGSSRTGKRKRDVAGRQEARRWKP